MAMNNAQSPQRPDPRESGSTGEVWMLSIAVVILVLGVVGFSMINQPETASTLPPVTTGQGGTAAPTQLPAR